MCILTSVCPFNCVLAIPVSVSLSLLPCSHVISRFGAEGLGSDTSLPYICSSLSAHPEADFDLLNGDGDAITMCSELFLGEHLKINELS